MRKYKQYYKQKNSIENLYVYIKKSIYTKEGFDFFCNQVILIGSVYKKNKNYYPKVFWEKYSSNKDIEIYSSNSYYVDSDKE